MIAQPARRSRTVGVSANRGGLSRRARQRPLRGGDQADTLDGGTGNDALIGERAISLIVGGPGVDLLSGGDGNDLLLAADGTRDVGGGHRAIVDRKDFVTRTCQQFRVVR